MVLIEIEKMTTNHVELVDRHVISNDCPEKQSPFDSFEEYLDHLDSFLKFDSPDKWLGIQEENDSNEKLSPETSSECDMEERCIYSRKPVSFKCKDSVFSDKSQNSSLLATLETPACFPLETPACFPSETQSESINETEQFKSISKKRRLTCDEFIFYLKDTRESLSLNCPKVAQNNLISEVDTSNLSKMERKRLNIINEIRASEQTYFHHLELIFNLFMEPIQNLNVLPEKVASSIFNNIQLIMAINKELSFHLSTKPVGEAFLLLAPFLKLYSTYAQNHERAIATLLEWDQKSPEFARFRRQQEEHSEMKGLKLNALLITPVQRIPRYKMLLEELLKCTPTIHGDFKHLQDAAEEIASVANHINEHIRQQENFMKMLAIQKSLSGPRLLIPGRTFIKEGSLKKVSSYGTKYHERIFFLFSDVLIYAKPRLLDPTSGGQHHSLKCCCILPLQHCIVDRVLGGNQGQGSLFSIKCKNEFLLLFSDQSTVSEWISVLRKQICEIKTNRKTLRKKSSAVQPLRQEKFLSLFKRKLTPKNTPEKNSKNNLASNHLKSDTPLNSPKARKDQVIHGRSVALACIRKSKEETAEAHNHDKPKVFKDFTLIEENSIFVGNNITLNDSVIGNNLPLNVARSEEILSNAFSTILESDERCRASELEELSTSDGFNCHSSSDQSHNLQLNETPPMTPYFCLTPSSFPSNSNDDASDLTMFTPPHIHVTIRKNPRSNNGKILRKNNKHANQIH